MNLLVSSCESDTRYRTNTEHSTLLSKNSATYTNFVDPINFGTKHKL